MLCITKQNVGAILDRPPKIKDFRISRREITVFRLTATDFAKENLRATRGRPCDMDTLRTA